MRRWGFGRWSGSGRSYYSSVSIKSSIYRSEGQGIPEVVWRVAISDQDNGDSGIVLNGIDSVGGARVVFLGMRREGSKERFSIHHEQVTPFSKVRM